MHRHLASIILLACLLFGTIHFGEEQVAPGAYAQAGCSISAGCGTDAHPCHEENGDGCEDGHCCGIHLHLHTIAGARHEFSHFMPSRQFTALLPHFFPSDHLQERFIPPRRTA